MTKYFIGAIGALVGALAGAWLMLAPFALAYQPSGADWADPTFADFWTGLPLLVVSLVGLVTYVLGLVEEMRDQGIIQRVDYTTQPQATDAPQNGSVPGNSQQSETEQMLLPLIAAMLKDMQDQQQRREDRSSHEAHGDSSNNQEVSERRVQQ